MKVAITGYSGFVGGNLALELLAQGHEVVGISRGVDQRNLSRRVSNLPGITICQVADFEIDQLALAFDGCNAVVHCAGINREIGDQTYDSVHIRGTRNVVLAMEKCKVDRLCFISFLRARPNCGSRYHESKWAAEEIIRGSKLDWTILKPGMMFGTGDHMLDHLSRALRTFPVYLGIGDRRVRPLAVEDLVAVIIASIVGGRNSMRTLGLVGPSELGFDQAARLVARATSVRRPFIRVPIIFHYLLAKVSELAMTVPLISQAQVRILREEVIEATCAPDFLDDDLIPAIEFSEHNIVSRLPSQVRYRLDDLRWFSAESKIGQPKQLSADLSDKEPRSNNLTLGGELLIFDGDCGFCTASAKWANTKFQSRQQVVSYQSLSPRELTGLGLTTADVTSAAWWIDRAGNRFRGHLAIGRALRAGGGFRGFVGVLFMYPPTSWISKLGYSFLVKFRHKLPGSTEQCKL